MDLKLSLDLPILGKNFVWGTATASFQIEGAVNEGGRGKTSWDAFTAVPGNILGGDTADVACDHYHRYQEDVDLMKELGLDAYRFSFAWSRIQPTGSGPVNREGLDFYDRLVDSLLEAGVAPAPTLFHWDTPLALEEAGGWLNRDTVDRFADYAHIMGEHFSDRIKQWMTINEPVVLTMFGHGAGVHAPGKSLGFGALPVAHNLLLAHGRGVTALREAGAVNIGLANNHAPTWPDSQEPEDLMAAGLYDNISNWIFADPILLGKYPEEMAALLPEGLEDDLKEISVPIDFYGINYYNPTLVAAPSAEGPGNLDGVEIGIELPFTIKDIEGYPLTDFGWPSVPSAFTDLLVGFKERYGDKLPPIFITENGCAINDGVGPDGKVHDPRRIEYTDTHLRAVKDAMDQGVDVRGYFHWSLLDNFEWAAGNSTRFGLIHTNFETLERTPKDSFYWYQSVIKANK